MQKLGRDIEFLSGVILKYNQKLIAERTVLKNQDIFFIKVHFFLK